MVWDHEVPGSNPGAPTTVHRLACSGRATDLLASRSHRVARPLRAFHGVAALAVTVATVLSACGPSAPATPRPTLTPLERKQLPTATPLPAVVDPTGSVTPRSTVYLQGVNVPVGLSFAPDGRLFFSETFDSKVRVAVPNADRGRLLDQPFASLLTAKGAEAGMLGLALDPNFEENHWVYLYYSEADPNRKDRVPLRNRVVRFTERDNVGTDMTVILDDIAISRQGVHNGGILAFGHDGTLYVTVGNAQERSNSQDMKSLNGKVLRINPDGSVPSDNPFPGSPIFALGFRNPFGLTIQPDTGAVFVTDNSGDTNDEVNLVRAGGNYGFPHHEGIGNDPNFVDPLWESGSKTIGPTGLTFYTGDQIPQYRGDLFFCAVLTGTLMRLRLTPPTYDRAEAAEEVAKDCNLSVTNGPDGALYYSSMSQVMRLGR
jgi:glucose/arabinose dehydrogenase